MGMPFPAALEMVKERSSPAFTALLFGISGGASTIASAAALLINVESGFTASFSLGTALYAAGFLFFILLLLLTRKRAAA
jgi:dipeptide/tripeptide permease